MIIRWSYKAQKQQDAVADYIFNEFGGLALRKFYKKIDTIEEKLIEFPELGKIEQLLNALWDTRREPKAQARKLK